MANQYTLKNGGYEPFIGNFGLVPQPPIPEPDAEDNGKVLGVSNGSYALVNGGGGGSGMVVECSLNEQGFEVLECPSDELYQAFEEGKNIVFEMTVANTKLVRTINQAVRQTVDGIASYVFIALESDDQANIVAKNYVAIGSSYPVLTA